MEIKAEYLKFFYKIMKLCSRFYILKPKSFIDLALASI